MEVGAVKQAFNNELILMKKSLNQAKTHTIHKLTRKAKTLTEKKTSEKFKQKLTRKAELAVKEVLEIKKIKPRDVAKFAITHTGELKNYLNKPTVDQERVCSRLLLHKSMQEKYKIIRRRFANIPIRDLFMSRQERLKLKKEEKEKKKHKKELKNRKTSNSGEWDVEEIKTSNEHIVTENGNSDLSNEHDIINGSNKPSDIEEESEIESESEHDNAASELENEVDDSEQINIKSLESKELPTHKIKDYNNISDLPLPKKKETKQKPVKKHKENKNKNLNEKLSQRKFKKDTDVTQLIENKIVDPFFITSTGENYMSVAEPRQPDEFKEIHRQGNRKLRRAAMFGHVPKIKPRRNNYEGNNFNTNNFSRNREEDFSTKSSGRFDNSKQSNFNYKDNDNKKTFGGKNENVAKKEEKLHPSWEAKKKQSGILPFQGKKIVFDES